MSKTSPVKTANKAAQRKNLRAPAASPMAQMAEQAGKVAAKAEEAKTAAKGKTQRKPAAKKADAPKVEKKAKQIVAFVARSPKTNLVHIISEDARPTAGGRLYAHTHAALSLLGLLNAERPAVSKKAVLTVMGQRAVAYHLKQMNFEHAPENKLRLSTSGRNKFMDRVNTGQVDGKLANAFTDLFIDGKVDSSTGISSGNVYSAAL